MLAAPVAGLLEGSRLVKTRWDFSDADFSRLWTLCVVLFAGAAVGSFFSGDNAMTQSRRAMLTFIQWQPFVFLPIVAAQAYSQRDKIDLAVFSGLVRRWRKTRPRVGPLQGVNVAMPYLSICL